MLAARLLGRALPLLCLASCSVAGRPPTYADLCRSEMAVPAAPPDTSARLRALERELADSVKALVAREKLHLNAYQVAGMAVALGERRIGGYSDGLTALLLAEIRGLFDDNFLGHRDLLSNLVWMLGREHDGPERLWSLLGVPPAECRMPGCPLSVIVVASLAPAPRNRPLDRSDRRYNAYLRGAFCRLVTLGTDSSGRPHAVDLRALRTDTSAYVGGAELVLMELAKSARKSDAEFLRKALRAARASGPLGVLIAERHEAWMRGAAGLQ